MQKVFIKLKVKTVEETRNQGDIESGKKWIIVFYVEEPRKDSPTPDEYTVRYKSRINIDKADYGKVFVFEAYPFAKTQEKEKFSKVSFTILAQHKSI